MFNDDCRYSVGIDFTFGNATDCNDAQIPKRHLDEWSCIVEIDVNCYNLCKEYLKPNSNEKCISWRFTK